MKSGVARSKLCLTQNLKTLYKGAEPIHQIGIIPFDKILIDISDHFTISLTDKMTI